MNRDLARRMRRIEQVRRSDRDRLFVISDLGDGHRFFTENGRVMTVAELDQVEADLFASGKALPGDTVVRIVHTFLDQPFPDRPAKGVQ